MKVPWLLQVWSVISTTIVQKAYCKQHFIQIYLRIWRDKYPRRMCQVLVLERFAYWWWKKRFWLSMDGSLASLEWQTFHLGTWDAGCHLYKNRWGRLTSFHWACDVLSSLTFEAALKYSFLSYLSVLLPLLVPDRFSMVYKSLHYLHDYKNLSDCNC